MEQDNLYDEPVRLWQRIHPSYWAMVNQLILAYGIYMSNWDFYLLLYVLWVELFIVMATMLVRVTFAREYRRGFNMTGEKISFFFIGILLSTTCITLMKAMSYDLFSGEIRLGQFSAPLYLILMLGLNHVIRLGLHYFQNERFRKANPATEMIVSFMYQVGIVVILIAIGAYYLPRYPHAGEVKDMALKLLSFRLFMDLLYCGFHHTVIEWFSPPATIEALKKKKP